MRLRLALFVFALSLFLGCNDDEPTEVPTPQGQKIYVPDWNYVQGKYFSLVNPNDPSAYDGPITKVRLYLDDKDPRNNVELGALQANIWLDPRNKTGPSVSGQFHLLTEEKDFTAFDVYNFGLSRITLTTALSPYQTLAVAYIQTVGAAEETVGTWVGSFPDSETVLDLKMLRPSDDQWGTTDLTQSPWDDVRYLETKNVYSIGVRDIEPGTMRVDVVRDIGGPTGQNPTFIDNEWGKRTLLLQVLGLDQKNNANVTDRTPDERIDPEYVDLADGLIFFPDLRPFDPDAADVAGVPGGRDRSWPHAPGVERPDTLGWTNVDGQPVMSVADRRQEEVMPAIYDLRFSHLVVHNLLYHRYTIVITLQPTQYP